MPHIDLQNRAALSAFQALSMHDESEGYGGPGPDPDGSD